MFTVLRPIAAMILGVFAVFAAQVYEPLYYEGANLGRFPLVAAVCAAVVGWMFLGGRIGKALWLSMFLGVQAVVLSAVTTAMVLAVREVFVRGYRQQFRGVVEAAESYFGFVVDWLSRGLVTDYLILLGVGGLAIGLILHILDKVLERRRNDR